MTVLEKLNDLSLASKFPPNVGPLSAKIPPVQSANPIFWSKGVVIGMFKKFIKYRNNIII